MSVFTLAVKFTTLTIPERTSVLGVCIILSIIEIKFANLIRLVS